MRCGKTLDFSGIDIKMSAIFQRYQTLEHFKALLRIGPLLTAICLFRLLLPGLSGWHEPELIKTECQLCCMGKR